MLGWSRRDPSFFWSATRMQLDLRNYSPLFSSVGTGHSTTSGLATSSDSVLKDSQGKCKDFVFYLFKFGMTAKIFSSEIVLDCHRPPAKRPLQDKK